MSQCIAFFGDRWRNTLARRPPEPFALPTYR